MLRISSQFKRTVIWTAAIACAITAGTWANVLYYVRADHAPVPLEDLKATLNDSVSRSLTLRVSGRSVVVSPSIMSKWLEPYTRSYTNRNDVRISDRLSDYLLTLSRETEKPARDARFIVSDGQISITSPSQAGSRLDLPASNHLIRKALIRGEREVDLPLQNIQPALTEEVISGLDITEKLATGQSNFSGSSIARIQNISVSSSLYNGLLIPAGQTFSFNEILGEVDAEHGYAPEKVITAGKIEYQYGGGICQVSTTVFRAAIAAGLPIVERRNHSFPVAYYEPQGFDATIYPGVTDLRFINDTPSYVLIQTRISGKNIYIDFYGTSDGRSTVLNGPYQYDIQPDGAMKATFTRTTTYSDGTAKSDRFNSNYKSPNLYPTEPNPYL